MSSSQKELAKKYHSLEDDAWVALGSNTIELLEHSYSLNSNHFESVQDLSAAIKANQIKNALVLYDNNATPIEIKVVCEALNSASDVIIAIKNVNTYQAR